MGVYLVALTVGVPCALFLLYCLTPKGKHWLRVNGMLCPSYLSIYQFIFFSRLSGSRYHKEGGPESHGERMAALFFSPSQPRNAKISAETAGMSGNCCIFAAVIKKEKRLWKQGK